MSITPVQGETPWLLLVFTLPATKASERVGVWRRLQKYGAVSLPASGHVLPNNPANHERFEWLATSIRNTKGHASVAQVSFFSDLPDQDLEQMFIQARSQDYLALEKELKRMGKKGRRKVPEGAVLRLKRRLQTIAEIDFFNCPARGRIEEALHQLEHGGRKESQRGYHAKDYVGRTWITRPRPGIDRVASAWLIRCFIDADARFIFDNDPSRHADAVPFDMFHGGGFGHRGNDCTFETLRRSFAIRDRRVALVAQAIHDADLADDRFGRHEAMGIDRVLDGWNAEGVSDEELLRRGMEMIEGLYRGIR